MQKRKQSIGFTLVELMVVIALIAVLVGLLVPTIYGAIARAKNARTAMEISSIASSLEAYKLEYGEYPPDFSIDDGSGSNANRRAKQLLIRTHLSRIFRRRAAPAIPNGNFWVDPDNQPSDDLSGPMLDALNPSTALAFWLRGFTDDPQFPLNAAGARNRLFEFDQGRMVSRLGDADPDLRFATYSPKGIATPYVYYRAGATSAPDINPYGRAFLNAVNNIQAVQSMTQDQRTSLVAYVDAYAWAERSFNRNGSQFLAPHPYFSHTKNTNNPNEYVNINAGNGYPSTLWPYAEPNKFQIISSGADGEFGIGGNPANGSGNIRQGKMPVIGANSTGNKSRADFDNITNLAGGILQDLEN